MLMLIASALRWKVAVPAGWYWYALAIESLILDRAAVSVTLEAPSTKFARVRALPSSRGGRTK